MKSTKAVLLGSRGPTGSPTRREALPPSHFLSPAEARPNMSLLSAIESDTITVVPWPDDVIDALGHDPRSNYVETYWLGTLGPSTTWLLRRLVAGLDTEPNGYEMSLS